MLLILILKVTPQRFKLSIRILYGTYGGSQVYLFFKMLLTAEIGFKSSLEHFHSN